MRIKPASVIRATGSKHVQLLLVPLPSICHGRSDHLQDAAVRAGAQAQFQDEFPGLADEPQPAYLGNVRLEKLKLNYGR